MSNDDWKKPGAEGSGLKKVFASVRSTEHGMHVNEHGGNRDSAKGKLDYTLIPIPALKRVAQHYLNGANKYGRGNWLKLDTPEDIERYRQSMFRHLIEYLGGEASEDHLAAVVWIAMALLYYEETTEVKMDKEKLNL